MSTRITSTLAAVAALVGCASTTDPRANVSTDLETPAYTTLVREGSFELRRYPPFIMARVRVAGDIDSASGDGFRLLAAYIFGANQSAATVAMTAPVAATPVASSEKIAMTAPVAARPVGEEWEISFMMPSRYTLDTLPVPNDPRVELAVAEASCRAVVVFPGFTGDRIVDTQREALQSWLRGRGLRASSEPVLARYNDPLTLPWNRRNEVMLDVQGAECPSASDIKA